MFILFSATVDDAQQFAATAFSNRSCHERQPSQENLGETLACFLIQTDFPVPK
ncbi:hypothetical protein OVY48_02835 [Sphingobium sp. SA2]|jgi:hypothetical protein|uniref:hypothetical protein n=1 Tax=unclassified Sphingobium TaxID=2611147 RepID=UPI000502BCDB|nr:MULTISPECIES: hypothetical protein [unclassified Sphingobium]KFL46198.1 hypothetical protein IL54_1614 [Sphingobium sp. ba1]MDT7532377.1 hypothetical protein [Sphingobium sp. SA2]